MAGVWRFLFLRFDRGKMNAFGRYVDLETFLISDIERRKLAQRCPNAYHSTGMASRDYELIIQAQSGYVIQNDGINGGANSAWIL
jgi:hypothetical protein